MEIPEDAFLKDISAHYNRLTFPRDLRAPSALPAETWGKVIAENGELELSLEGSGAQTVDPDHPGVVPPEVAFRLEPKSKEMVFFLEYFHESRLHDPAQLAAALGRKPARRQTSS